LFYRSNGIKVIKEISLKNFDTCQGHSRSSEPIRIDPAPMTSYSTIANVGHSRTEINGDFSRKSHIFPPFRVFDAPAEGVPLEIGQWRMEAKN